MVNFILGLKTKTLLHFSYNYITRSQKTKRDEFHLLIRGCNF